MKIEKSVNESPYILNTKVDLGLAPSLGPYDKGPNMDFNGGLLG